MIRVFVIEDNEGDRVLIREHLEAAGDFEIVGEAKFVGDALRGVQETEPDVITLDEVLPTVAGTTLINGLRLQVGATPIVGFTGSADPSNLQRAGADDAIGKWEVEQLPERLRKVVEKHRGRPGTGKAERRPRQGDEAPFEEVVGMVRKAREAMYRGRG